MKATDLQGPLILAACAQRCLAFLLDLRREDRIQIISGKHAGLIISLDAYSLPHSLVGCAKLRLSTNPVEPLLDATRLQGTHKAIESSDLLLTS